jgi:hypothetical protein
VLKCALQFFNIHSNLKNHRFASRRDTQAHFLTMNSESASKIK